MARIWLARAGSRPTGGINAPPELVRVLALIGVKRQSPIWTPVPSELPVSECLRCGLLPGQYICAPELTRRFKGSGELTRLDSDRDPQVVVIEVNPSEVKDDREARENYELKAGFYRSYLSVKQVKSIPAFRAGQIVAAHKGGELHLVVWWGDKRDASSIRIMEVADNFLPSASKDLDTYEFAPTPEFAARLSLTICNSTDLERLREVSITLHEVLASDPRVIYHDKKGSRLWKRLTNANNGKMESVQAPSGSRRTGRLSRQ